MSSKSSTKKSVVKTRIDMSTRRLSCEHDNWLILPGNNIRCSDCGDTINSEDLADWMNPGDPVTITMGAVIPPCPLTHKLGEHILGLS